MNIQSFPTQLGRVSFRGLEKPLVPPSEQTNINSTNKPDKLETLKLPRINEVPTEEAPPSAKGGVKKTNPLVKRHLIKSVLSGLISPLRSIVGFIFTNPVKAGVFLGASMFALSTVPLLSAFLSWGMLGYGAYQAGKGVGSIFVAIRTNDNKKANEGAENIGRGLFDIAFSYKAALRELNDCHSAIKLINSFKGELTFPQKLHIILKQTPHGTPLEDLKKFPASWDELTKDWKNTFFSLFDKNNHKVPGVPQEHVKVAETAAKLRGRAVDKINAFVERNAGTSRYEQKISALKSLLEKVKEGNVSAGILTLPNLLKTFHEEPELAGALAEVLHSEKAMHGLVLLLDDLRSIVATSTHTDESEDHSVDTPPLDQPVAVFQ